MFVPPGERPAYMLTKELLTAFEGGDLAQNKMGKFGNNGNDYLQRLSP